MNSYLRVFKFVKPYWSRILIAILCTLLYSVFSGASIYLFIPLLDMLFHPEKVLSGGGIGGEMKLPIGLGGIFEGIKEGFLHSVFQGEQIEVLVKICLIIFSAFFFKNLFGYLQSYINIYVEEGVVRDVRNELYRHLHDLPLSFFTNERTGDLISRVTNDVTLINGGVTAVMFTIIREPLLIIVFLSLAFSLSWKLTLISLFVFPFALIIIAWIAVRLRRERGVSQERLADITSILHETISGVKVVKAFGMEGFESKKFKKQTKNYFQSLIKISRMRDLASPSTEILSIAAGAVIIWYGGIQVLVEHTLNASEFLGFLMIIFQTMPPFKELSSVNNRIQESSAAAKRIFEILDTKPSIQNLPNAVHLKEFSSSIEFKDVSFMYNGSDEVLTGVNITIKKGEVVALVGPSGSGKTTLVDLVPRFYDPTSGAIHIDGFDLRQVELKSLRDKVSIVTQETVLFNDTVRNNIAYGLEQCPLEEVIAAAKAANAYNFIMEMPDKFESIIGERGVKLSGGERQRLSLARAILKNPPILILDEATSALDTESEILVQQAIENLMEGRTSLVIAHRLSTVQHADRIVVLQDGKVVEEGKHDDLLEISNGLYRKLYNLQFRI